MGLAGRLDLTIALIVTLIKTGSRLHPRKRNVGKVAWHRRVPALFLT